VLQNVRYMAGVSGSALPVAPLGYLPEKFPVEAFFGPLPTGPKALTAEELKNPLEGSFASSLFLGPATDMAKRGVCSLVCQDTRYLFSCGNVGAATCCGQPFALHAYTAALVYPLLNPWDLYVAGSVMSGPIGSESYKRAVDAVSPAGCKVTPMRRSVPFPIIVNSRLIEADGHDSSWCAYEATPLYCGTPVDFSSAPGGAVGCGVVESFGAGSPPPASLPGGRRAVEDGEQVKVKPTTFTPLPFMVGSSAGDMFTYSMWQTSCLPYSAAQNVAMGGNALPVWSPADIASKNNGLRVLEDGGPCDCCGLLALLRRRAKRIFVQCCDGFDIAHIHDMGKASWWTAYWGQAKEHSVEKYSMNAADMNRLQQVFDAKYYEPFIHELKKKAKAGLPVTAELKLPVMENRFCGVEGGWEVHLLWTMPCRPAAFIDALPEATKQRMLQDPGKNTIDVSNETPFTASFGSYTMDVTRMEIELAAWTLLNGFPATTLRDFFGSATPRKKGEGEQESPCNTPSTAA